MPFADRLIAAVSAAKTPVLVGIDPVPESLPAGFLDKFSNDRAGVAEALGVFGAEVVDVVAGMVPAVKFQAAYFEAYGPEGVAALHAAAARARARNLVVLIDGKRNDIGPTAEAYARAYLGEVPVGDRLEAAWDADALTVNPYLGSDGILPFVKTCEAHDKGLFVLVRTSNPSAGEFQDLVSGGKPLYRHVADRVAEWGSASVGPSGYSAVGAVVGATYPEELAELRRDLPHAIFLVPGYGAQGGTARDVAPAFDDRGHGALVNNSRGLIFAYRREDLKGRFGPRWQDAIAEAVRIMADDLAGGTPATLLRSPG